MSEIIQAKLNFLYGPERGSQFYGQLLSRMEDFRQKVKSRGTTQADFVTERDVILITYGDLLRCSGSKHLQTLTDFLISHLKDTISTVHILPFFPYSSDDGFSVIDYRKVDPALGSWDNIRQLKDHFKLMFDAVVNHISRQSKWFQRFLAGDTKYRDYFITVEPGTDLSMVVRPRALPLLTPVETQWGGKQQVWTTFSDDQIDLNYATPEVLMEILDLLLFFVEHGADVVRLDAIAYLWKEIGTACIHLPQTHAVIQLMRAVLDEVAPWVLIITETNVPHEENISYFGDGTNEAHLVYQFSLPPLTAHAILTGSAHHLRKWAASLETPSDQVTFFNFTASHDGVGVRPAIGILSDAEINLLIEHTTANGGHVSYKTDRDGSKSPYELNITYYDLLNSPDSDEPQELQVQRFLVSQAIMLALAGVPGIYFHSLLGSRNYTAGVTQTGHPRTINREKLEVSLVEADLNNSGTLRRAVFSDYKSLIQKRTQEEAFHPSGEQQVLPLDDSIFGLLRRSPAGDEMIITLHNLSGERQAATLDMGQFELTPSLKYHDIVSDKIYYKTQSNLLEFELEPYQFAWLKC
jgi:glycosidase